MWFKRIAERTSKYNVVNIARPLARDKEILKQYEGLENVKIVRGNLTNYNDLKTCVDGVDIVLHVAAFVSPMADYDPEQAIKLTKAQQ